MLSALARALGLPLTALIDAAAERTSRFYVVRASERVGSIDPGSGARREIFGPAMFGSKIEFLRYGVPPRTLAGPFDAHATGTLEHMHLAAGRIRAVFGADEVTLQAGDSCTCLADATHFFDNRDSQVEALIYIVVERP